MVSETLVGIEKESKLSEIAAPTLSSMEKLYLYHFQYSKDSEKKSRKKNKTICKMVFQNSCQNHEAVKRERGSRSDI